MINKSGFFVLELWVSLVISALFLGSIFVVSGYWMDALRVKSSVFSFYHFLYHARLRARLSYQDTLIFVFDKKNVVLMPLEYRLGLSSQIALNRDFLGFTRLGHTKYAGTARLFSGSFEKRVTLGVGFGQMAFY